MRKWMMSPEATHCDHRAINDIDELWRFQYIADRRTEREGRKGRNQEEAGMILDDAKLDQVGWWSPSV